ncbi:MAG: M20/M25/M40 family metallo-hydrolase, partial [Acidobacteria bacterium]|nr:M20/M25/M40 family metallo-hydrolase [Acidobacteriota bacterium]
MLRRYTAVALLACILSPPCGALAQQPAPQTPPSQAPAKDPNDPVERIKDEGMNRSQLMQTLSYLTDVIGPRLTGSPNMKRANEWTRDRLTSWGLVNARLEAWGPFGRGWSLKSFSAQIVEPQAIPLIAYPKAWSPGTHGQLVADVVYVDVKTESDFEKYRGKLKGAIVLTTPPADVKARFDPLGHRLDEKDLLKLADALDPKSSPPQRRAVTPEQRAAARLLAKKYQFFAGESPALLVDPSRAGDGGTIFVQSATVPQGYIEDANAPGAPRRVNPWQRDAPVLIPQLVLAVEPYNRIIRMLQQGVRVRMAVRLDVQFHDADPMNYNTVAEIPGSDLKDEVVMLGGHMDSWHAGTGATDNAAGVAVAMEAVRILRALKLQPRRTIRVALWSGEEQGLLGSKAYVKEHFGELAAPTPQPSPPGADEGKPVAAPSPPPPSKLITKPEYEKFSAYFNLDNGTGRIRGVYLQGNEAVRPLFRDWLIPFRETGTQTLSIANTGSTDHVSFDAIGLPGFQFIQDPVEYDTRTHHSNQDVFDRIQADDLKQAA